MSVMQKLQLSAPFTIFLNRLPKIGLAHVSLFFVGLMWVLPFQYGEHWLPITTFYQEWGASMLGICAMPLLLARRCWRQPAIPRIILLPLGFILLLWLQYFLGKLPYLSQAIMVTLYLLWAGLLMMLGQRLREELGLPALVTSLALFLLIGGELSALIGIVQNYEWRNIVFDYLVSVKSGPAIFANMGQQNHLANYISIALFSLGLLRIRWKILAWKVTLLAAPLLFVLVLSGSRSGWLYLVMMVIIAFFWQRRDKTIRPLLDYSLFLVLGFVLMHFVVQIPFLSGHNGSITSFDRLVESADHAGIGKEKVLATNTNWFNRDIRLNIWHESWLIFTQHPIVGAGFGSFAWQHFQLMASLHNTVSPGLYNHAHNILLETAAEMGSLGVLLLLGTITLWIRQARRDHATIYNWWGIGLLAVICIHSLLEYPLFYSYFLGLAAVTIGVFDSTVFRFRFGFLGRMLITAILLFGMLSMSQLWQGYRKIEAASFSFSRSNQNDYERRLNFERLRAVQGFQELLWRSNIELGLGEMGWNHIADKRALNERVIRFSPHSPAVYREAILLARVGLQAEAQAQLERAIWAYPADLPVNNLDSLRKLADMDTDPNRYPALLEFSLKVYAEQQRAMSGQ